MEERLTVVCLLLLDEKIRSQHTVYISYTCLSCIDAVQLMKGFNMRVVGLVRLCTILATLFLVACNPSTPDSDAAATPPNDSLMNVVAARGDGDGAEAVFREHCASCHMGNSRGTHSPSLWHLASMPPRSILAAMQSGKMREQASALTEPEKIRLATWLTGVAPGDEDIPDSAYCAAVPNKPGTPVATIYSSGWGGNGNATGYYPGSDTGVTSDNVAGLKLDWVFAVPGSGEMRSKPAVVGDRLFFGSEFGAVYGLDRKTGCALWVYNAGVAIRGAVNVQLNSEGKLHLYFADMRGTVHKLDGDTGKALWTMNAASHYMGSVTGSVAFHDNRIFVPFSSTEIVSTRDSDYQCCHTAGEVAAVDATDGKLLWRFRTIEEPATEHGKNNAGAPSFGPSGAPVWSSPTADGKRGLVYFGTGENFTRPATKTSDAIFALDMKTGAVAWSHQATANDVWNLDCGTENNTHCPEAGPDLDFGMAPMLVTRPDGRDVLIVGQKSGHVHALDPDKQGELLWSTRVGRGGALGGIHWGMSSNGTLAYAPLADFPALVVVEQEPFHPSSPGVAAVDVTTGKLIWRHDNPAAACEEKDSNCLTGNSAATTAIPGAVFTGSMDGIIRAISAQDGSVLWEFNTAREFETVNQTKGHGGSVEGPGPVVAGDSLYVLSGYTTNLGLAGNLLLAFKLDQD
jgi:polyvinyl alcohol dehydrogenase (cytochrome)